jgi:phospholipase C
MPAATVNPSFLLDDMNPIQNIVVLMQENRSFDTYMGHLYKYEVDVLGRKTATAINSAPDNTTNTDLMGMTHPYQHAPHLCFADTDHSWRGSHVDWDKGKNDLFFDVNDGTMVNEAGVNLLDGDRALWWYDERDIPFYYSLYSTFAISDSYFCALLGPTWPNRAYLYDATSLGITESTFPNLTNYETVPTNLLVFDELAQRGVPFNIFAESVPGIGLVLGPSVTTRYGSLKPIVPLADFFTRAKAGTLPPVSFVDPDFLDEAMGSDDEHPPGDVEVGQGATWKVVNALLTSPQWAHSALFITYDEGGGEYDHVSPPPACAPDDLKPILTGTDVGTTGDFTRYGFRVPLVIVSPYARKSFVSHTTYSHTSITRFIEAKFKLPALTARDANADPFSDMFDWTNPPFAKPPTFAEPKVDTSALAFCKATY